MSDSDKCIVPTQENIVLLLSTTHGKKFSINDIRFRLDFIHGCVFSPSRILKVLKSLLKKDQIDYCFDARKRTSGDLLYFINKTECRK